MSWQLKLAKCYSSALVCWIICCQFVQGTVLIRNAAELKSFSKGEEEHLEKVSSRIFCSPHKQVTIISSWFLSWLLSFKCQIKQAAFLHDLLAWISLVTLVGVLSLGGCMHWVRRLSHLAFNWSWIKCRLTNSLIKVYSHMEGYWVQWLGEGKDRIFTGLHIWTTYVEFSLKMICLT